MAPDVGQAFLGSQGDPWDAQWDMLLGLVGGILGSLAGLVLGGVIAKGAGGFFGDAMRVQPSTMLVAWVVAALVGFLSAIIPAYHASEIGIVEGLRHIG